MRRIKLFLFAAIASFFLFFFVGCLIGLLTFLLEYRPLDFEVIFYASLLFAIAMGLSTGISIILYIG